MTVGIRLRGATLGDTLAADIRFAFRQLRHAPAFTSAAILTLAIGIGLTVAVFSVADGILFKPLPYRDPHRLVILQGWDETSRTAYSSVPASVIAAATAGTSTLEPIAGSARTMGSTLRSTDPKEAPFKTATISTNGLDLLGIRPIQGRSFADGDESSSPRSALLSYESWRRRFGADSAVLGRTLAFDRQTLLIVGILPPFVPMPGFAVVTDYDFLLATPRPGQRGGTALAPFGRLRPGATIAAADAELNRINDAARGRVGTPGRDTAVRVSALQYGMLELRRPAMLTLAIAVALVFLITVANLANLFLSRGTSRTTELSVRTALGASRSRLARMVLIEAALISAGAAFLAVILAASLYRTLFDVVPVQYRMLMPAALDGRALALVAISAVIVTTVLALVTAVQALRADVRYARGTQRRSGGEGALTLRFGRALLTVQAALSVAVIVGSALVVGSFARLATADMGFDVDGLTSSSLMPFAVQDTPENRATKYLRLEELIRGIPGVQVGMSDGAPWGGAAPRGMSADPSFRGGLYSVSPGFFPTLGVRLIDGRWPTATEWTSGSGIAIVNRAAAARLWPGVSAVGQVHQAPNSRSVAIIGVIDDLRSGRGKAAEPAMYVPYDFSVPLPPEFFFRSPLTSDRLATLLTGVVRNVRPGAPDVAAPIPATTALDVDLRLPRLVAGIFAIFAAAVIAIGAVGIVGLLVYLVQRRRYEIGVRMALGADGRAIRRLIYGRVFAPVTSGMVAGLTGAWWGVRYIESLLFELRGHDPRVFLIAAATLLLVTGVAAFGPARRAAATDPAIVLRAQ